MAPEVYKGEKYDSKVDVYSLGLVMYRLLNNGRMPLIPQDKKVVLRGDSDEAFERRMQGETLPAPSMADETLAKTICKACEYRVSNRYATPAEMKRDLMQALSELSKEEKDFIVLMPYTKSVLQQSSETPVQIPTGTVSKYDGLQSTEPPQHEMPEEPQPINGTISKFSGLGDVVETDAAECAGSNSSYSTSKNESAKQITQTHHNESTNQSGLIDSKFIRMTIWIVVFSFIPIAILLILFVNRNYLGMPSAYDMFDLIISVIISVYFRAGIIFLSIISLILLSRYISKRKTKEIRRSFGFLVFLSMIDSMTISFYFSMPGNTYLSFFQYAFYLLIIVFFSIIIGLTIQYTARESSKKYRVHTRLLFVFLPIWLYSEFIYLWVLGYLQTFTGPYLITPSINILILFICQLIHFVRLSAIIGLLIQKDVDKTKKTSSWRSYWGYIIISSGLSIPFFCCLFLFSPMHLAIILSIGYFVILQLSYVISKALLRRIIRRSVEMADK
jgi:hypothetical protein